LVVSSPADAAQKRTPAKKPAAKSVVAKKPAAPAFDEKALQTQVALDCAGFSPGEIDGRMGTSTKRALDAFAKNGGTLDATIEALVTYKITDADAAAAFTPDLPEDMMEKAKLPALGYKNLDEALGERFHVSPALLKSLNPQAKFAAGEAIKVPNVAEFAPTASAPTAFAPTASRPRPSPSGAQEHVRPRRHRQRGQGCLLRAGHDGQRTRSAADRRVESERRAEEPHVRLQPGFVLGCGRDARQGEDSRGTEQSGRRRVDRHFAAALRPARNARALDRRQDLVARLRPPHELGCAELPTLVRPGTKVVFAE
jgi:peptidoglycan hydrolase-like protein with peptidoglycan-binding domain